MGAALPFECEDAIELLAQFAEAFKMRQDEALDVFWYSGSHRASTSGKLDRMFYSLAESVGCIDDNQKNHSRESERFCMGEDHRAFQEHCESPCLNQTKPSFSRPGVCPSGKGGGRANQAGGNKNPETWILLSLHVGEYVRRDRKETCAECDDHLVNVPPLCGTDEFAAGVGFVLLLPCLGNWLACSLDLRTGFSIEIEVLKLYIVLREPGIHLGTGFNCLLITARSEVPALVGPSFVCSASTTHMQELLI